MDPSVSVFTSILFIVCGGAVLAIIRFALGLLNILASTKTASLYGSVGESLQPFIAYLKPLLEALFGPLTEMKHNLIHVLLAAVLLAIIFYGSRIPEPSSSSSSDGSPSSSKTKSTVSNTEKKHT